MADTPAPAPPSADDVTRHIDRYDKAFDRLLEWIRAVDAKTPVVMAIGTGMLGALAAVAPPPKQLTKLDLLWIGLGAIPLVGSIALCALATFPQTRGPSGSLIYFGGIVERPLPEFTRAAQRRTDGEHLEDLLTQCHRNAEIATAKFTWIRRALVWLVIAIPLWLAALYRLSSAP